MSKNSGWQPDALKKGIQCIPVDSLIEPHFWERWKKLYDMGKINALRSFDKYISYIVKEQ